MSVDNTTTMNGGRLPPEEAPDLSLVLGGPLYQAYLRCRLARPAIDLSARRITAFVVITWLIPAVLSVVEGHAVGGAAVPFFEHLGVQVRFLVMVPLLVAAEVVVHQRITRAVREFRGRALIAPEDEPRFNDAVGAALRLRNSTVIEILLLVLAFTLGTWLWRRHIAIHAPTWYGPGAGGALLTVAGYWYAFVSLPILRFLLVRWYFRIFIWYRFLWKVSRMPLRLNGLHPDKAGGLGFLDTTPFAFIPVLLAQMALTAGEIGDRIWHAGGRLPQFKLDMAGVLIFSLLLVYAPLTFFLTGLYRARWVGMRDYGNFASRYVNDFREKWTRGTPGGAVGEELGSGDIQSLADLANSFEVLHDMTLMPFALRSVLRLAIILALPLLPLIFTIVPLNELVDRLVKLVL